MKRKAFIQHLTKHGGELLPEGARLLFDGWGHHVHPMKSAVLALVFVGLTLMARGQDTSAGPVLELHRSEHYFRSEGRPAFVFGRNPAGMNPKEYDDHFRHAASSSPCRSFTVRWQFA